MTVLVHVPAQDQTRVSLALEQLNCEVEAVGYTKAGYAFQVETQYTPRDILDELRLRFGYARALEVRYI